MENIVIGNATYTIQRVFIGNQKVSDLIQERVKKENSQFLPLTSVLAPSYNSGGRNAGIRRSHAN